MKLLAFTEGPIFTFHMPTSGPLGFMRAKYLYGPLGLIRAKLLANEANAYGQHWFRVRFLSASYF